MNSLRPNTSQKLPGAVGPYTFPGLVVSGNLSRAVNHSLLVILPVLGLSFWFLVGFPFADRNESYIWITYLEQSSFLEIAQNPIPSIRNFRPLAQTATWCLYHLSGNDGTLVQGLNYILLCTAVCIMIPLIPVSKRTYISLLYLIIGFVYFSTFYYIFNLHGIFYSVILVTVALLLKAQQEVLTKWRTWCFIGVTLALFHPLILLLYTAYLMGWLVEIQQPDKTKSVLLTAILAGLFVVLEVLLPFSLFSVMDVRNLIGTMRNVETHSVTRFFTLALCSLPFLNKTGPQRRMLFAACILFVPMAIIYNVPFLLLLAFLILLALVIEGKWSLFALLIVAISFPITVGSGAPTKASIFIFLLPYLLLRTVSFSSVMNDWIPRAISFATLASITICLVLIRMEIKMPVITTLINPIVVEKGKTHQLKKALLFAEQQTPPRRIQFLQEKHANIRDRGQPRERNNFPPTKQKELNVYQRYTLSPNEWSKVRPWYITFGIDLQNDTLKLVYVLEEKNCLPAYVYEPSQDEIHHREPVWAKASDLAPLLESAN